MATLVMNVPDELQLKDLLMELKVREGVYNIKVIHSYFPSNWQINASASLRSIKKKRARPQPAVDEVSLASEASLAEAWLSPEDDHWDDFFKELCTDKAM